MRPGIDLTRPKRRGGGTGRRFAIFHPFGRFVTLMRTMRLRQGFFVLFFAACALLGAEARGAVVDDPIHPYPSDYHYQLRDVSGVRDGHTIEGAQWFATSFENWFWSSFHTDNTHIRYLRTRGAGTERAMVTSADLVYDYNHVYIDEWQPYPVGPLYDAYMDPIESLYLVIPEGRGSWTIRFANDRAHHFPWPEPASSDVVSRDAMQDILIDDLPNYTVQAAPNTPQRVAAGDSMEQTFRLLAEDTNAYGSVTGHATFRQSASLDMGFTGYRESLKIPLVVANVHDGLASDPGNELYFDMTIRETSGDLSGSYASGDVTGDVITRTQFRWGVAEDMTRNLGTLFIMTPYGGRMPTYTLISRITNRTGTRYRVQRYDTLGVPASDDVIGGRSPRDLDPLHWCYDLTPDLYGSLPASFLLNPQSQVAPGLVTVYENKVDTTYGSSESFRLYPFSNEGKKHDLRLFYRRIGGMTRLGRTYSHFTGDHYRWRVTAFDMTFADVVKNETNTERELTLLMGKPPVMPKAGYGFGGVSDKYIKAEALNAFEIAAPVPDGLVSMDREIVSKDASGDVVSRDVPAQIALLPTQIRLCIPRQEQLLVGLWDELAQLDGDRLLERFAQFGTVWVRSAQTNEFDMNLFSAIGNRGADIKECVRAFIYDDHLYLDFIALLADAKSPKAQYTAYCEIVKDDEVPYILLGDGAADGKWNLSFYVAATGANPQPGYPESGDKRPSQEEGGGGCNAWGLPFLALAALAGSGLLLRGYRRG